MIVLPAIDLMNGEVVRLRQGRAGEKTVYSKDPVAFARKWESGGADYLHLVDLDAAFSGVSRNLETVKQITRAISIPCELGGGMRSEEAIRDALDAGVARVVIGTRASESMEFVAQMVKKIGGEKIAVGIDAKNGIASVKGWTESAGVSASELAQKAEQAGVRTIIYTDIATDGMLEGPNFAELEHMLQMLNCNLIASGGVSSAKDVGRLAQWKQLYGVIIGKALYDGTLFLPEIIQITKGAARQAV